MPLPQQVHDFVASLEILGAPPQANAGDKITPRLEPALSGLDALANAEVLGRLDLSVLLNNIDLDLTGAEAGAAALQVVLKDVEFPPPADLKAADVDVGETAKRALPHLVPSPGTTTPPVPYVLSISPDIKGLLGKITGSIGALQHVAGTVAGTITGNLEKPSVLEQAPTVTASWRVTDANDVPLLEGTQVVSSVTSGAPSFVFLPEFMEAGATVSTSPRRIYCDVEIKKTPTSGPADTVKKTIGPATVEVPRVPFPSVMLLTEHAVGDRNFPGAVLVAVTGTSVVHGPDQVGTLLQPARQVLQNLAAVAAFSGAAGVIDSIVSTLNAATKVAFVRADVVNDLWHVTRTPGGLLGWGYEGWQDVASSLVLVGPPGRVASLHNRPNTWVGTGAFSITLGVSGTAVVGSFVPAVPSVSPATSTLNIIVSAVGGTFNDVVSSYKFSPL